MTGQSPAPAAGDIACRTLGRDDWPHIEALFGPRGACGGCWCMDWRVEKGGKLWESVKGEPNRKRFRQLVEAGEVHGILAFGGVSPVGWCSFGPRASFPRLKRARSLQREFGEGTWSIVCFFIPRQRLGEGIATALLSAAVDEAFRLGAGEIEAYPARVHPDKRLPSPFAWTGVPRMYEQAGFHRIDRPGIDRAIYLKEAV